MKFVESDSATINLDISSCNLSKENKVLNLVNQASNNSINGISPNLLLKVKSER